MRIHDTNIGLSRIHQCRQGFPGVSFSTCMRTLVEHFHCFPCIASFFLSVILKSVNALWIAYSLTPKAVAISCWYASGCSATYAFNFSGSIFRHVAFLFWGC
jgi:hypothetical protein